MSYPRLVSWKALLALSTATALIALGGAARADIFVSGNSAAFGNGPIATYNYTTGAFVGSFIPDGAFGSNNGRGLAVTNNEFFYTELSNGFGATDRIRVAPFNGGLGGHDIGSFANPAPNTGIQDLAFGARGLYVLTGYPPAPTSTSTSTPAETRSACPSRPAAEPPARPASISPSTACRFSSQPTSTASPTPISTAISSRKSRREARISRISVSSRTSRRRLRVPPNSAPGR